MSSLEVAARGTPAKVAFCITELDPGGAERALVELATRLDRGRFEPVVYCLGPRPVGNPSSLADVLERHGIAVHCLGARRSAAFPAVLGKLTRGWIAERPRIVQTFLFHANVLGALAARRAGVPHVVSGIRVAERRAGWHLLVARWADRWVDRHVCVSQAVRDFSVSRGLLPLDKLLVIPNGVDSQRFSAARAMPLASIGVSPDRRLIVCIGRLDAQKGVDWLLELMPRVFAVQPECALALVGDGPQRAPLAALAARLRIADRVHFLGFQGDVPQILAAGDLLVLPSRWEGMPNVVLEAMAAGKPVVATDVAGVREALGPGASQQVVAVNDPRIFADKIASFLGNHELAARVGGENQRRAAEQFSFAAMVAAYERLYTALISGGA